MTDAYQSPSIVDLGAFADLTQLGVGKANDESKALGSGGD
jgi:hypothetical protein